MTFDALLEQVVRQSGGIDPESAKEELAAAISARTRERLLKMKAVESIPVILNAVETINRGSIETVEQLILKQMQSKMGEKMSTTGKRGLRRIL